MPELNNQFPDWLDRRYSARSGTGSPWLSSAIQASMQRAEMQAKLPLQLQQLALANQHTQLQIMEQGLANELQGLQLQQYRDELPAFNEVARLAATDPQAFRNRAASFMSPRLQQQYVALRRAVAESDYGIAVQKQIAEDVQTAADVAKKTGYVVKRLPDGRIDPEDFKVGVEKLAEWEAKRLAAIHPSAAEYEPVVEELDYQGRKVPILVNKRTGRYELLKKAPDAAAKAEISMNTARVKELYKMHDEIPETGGGKWTFGGLRDPGETNAEKRAKIMQQIEALKARNRELTGETVGFGAPATVVPTTTAPASEQFFEFIPGKGIVPAAPTP